MITPPPTLPVPVPTVTENSNLSEKSSGKEFAGVLAQAQKPVAILNSEAVSTQETAIPDSPQAPKDTETPVTTPGVDSQVSSMTLSLAVIMAMPVLSLAAPIMPTGETGTATPSVVTPAIAQPLPQIPVAAATVEQSLLPIAPAIPAAPQPVQTAVALPQPTAPEPLLPTPILPGIPVDSRIPIPVPISATPGAESAILPATPLQPAVTSVPTGILKQLPADTALQTPVEIATPTVSTAPVSPQMVSPTTVPMATVPTAQTEAELQTLGPVQTTTEIGKSSIKTAASPETRDAVSQTSSQPTPTAAPTTLQTLDRWLTIGTPSLVASEAQEPVETTPLSPGTAVVSTTDTGASVKATQVEIPITAPVSGPRNAMAQVPHSKTEPINSAPLPVQNNGIQNTVTTSVENILRTGIVPNSMQPARAFTKTLSTDLSAKSIEEITTPQPTAASFTHAAVVAGQNTGSESFSEPGEQNPSEHEETTALHASAPAETAGKTGQEKLFTLPTERQAVSSTASVDSLQTASAKGADRADVASQVTRHLETMRLTNGRGEITMQLSPESLGSIHVKVTTRPEGVVAMITAETAHAQQAIENSKDQLRSALEQKGLRLSALDVNVGQQMQNGEGSSFSQRFFAPQQHAMSYAPRTGSATPLMEAETIGPVRPNLMEPTRSLSRLDYRA